MIHFPVGLRRDQLLADLRSSIERGQFAAIWGVRFSGRSTVLRRLAADYSRSSESLAVYALPNRLLFESRTTFFQSLARHIEATSQTTLPKLSDSVQWVQANALADFVGRLIRHGNLQRLVILIDDCDQIVSTSLVDLLRALRAIAHYRALAGSEDLRRLSVVVSGTVSFSNLRLLEPDKVSPIDDWLAFRLEDLSLQEATDHVLATLHGRGLHARAEAVDLLVEYGGGDLNRLNLLCSALSLASCQAGRADAEYAVARALSEPLSDPSCRYMVNVVGNDPLCLGVLDRVLKGSSQYVPSDLHPHQNINLDLTNPEISGGFHLERDKNRFPLRWKFRNRFSEEMLRRHFDTATIMRSLFDLGEDPRASAERVVEELAKAFREDVFSFSEVALRNLLNTYLGSPGTKSDAERRAQLIAHVLVDIFGVDGAALYEYADARLVPAQGETLVSFGLEVPCSVGLREERAVRTGSPYFEIEDGKSLQIALPLRGVGGSINGVASLRSKKIFESWDGLLARIPIMERALNLIWRRLPALQRDEPVLMLRGEESFRQSPNQLPVFVALKFNTPLHRSLKRRLENLAPRMAAEFLNFKPGSIYTELLNAMEERDPIGIFEISMINCNVFFELGLAIGLNRPGFPMLERAFLEVPTILRGMFCHVYHLKERTDRALCERIELTQSEYLARRMAENFIHMLGWEYRDEYLPHSPYIVVIDHDAYGDGTRFRRLVEKAAASRGLETRYLWTLDGHLKGHPEIPLDLHLQTTFTALRGALAVIARIEKIEDNAEYSSRFVATGIAKGLERRRRLPGVYLCARAKAQTGAKVEIPSDLESLQIDIFDLQRSKGFLEEVDARLALVQRLREES